MAIKVVNEDERLELVRNNIKNTAEIVTAIGIAVTNDELNNKAEAIAQLQEALNLLSIAYQDSFKDNQGTNTMEIDVLVVGEKRVSSLEKIED